MYGVHTDIISVERSLLGKALEAATFVSSELLEFD